MAAYSFSFFPLLFFFSTLISTAFSSMHEFYDEPLAVSSGGCPDLLMTAEHHFLAFKSKYGKTYHTQQEDDYRFGVFMTSLRQAKRTQMMDPTAVHGVTKFSDLTVTEFRRKYSSSRIKLPNDMEPEDVNSRAPHLSLQLPQSSNWIGRAVTRVRDQGQCNSCWAFATIAVVEGAYYRANNKLVELSEQQLIDCSGCLRAGLCNYGCCGGKRSVAFEYVKTHGVMAEKDYPYRKNGVCNKKPINASVLNAEDLFFSTIQNDQCQYVKEKVIAYIESYYNIKGQDQLAAYLHSHGPIAAIVEPDSLKSYKSGVLCHKTESSPGAEIPAHAVTLVGYENRTTSNGKFHWIVKNSYGENNGEEGYFRICNDNLLRDEAIIAIAKKQTPSTLP